MVERIKIAATSDNRRKAAPDPECITPDKRTQRGLGVGVREMPTIPQTQAIGIGKDPECLTADERIHAGLVATLRRREAMEEDLEVSLTRRPMIGWETT